MSWDKYAFKVTNSEGIYRDFLSRIGAESITHHSFIPFGDPRSRQFLDNIEYHQHLYETGDTLSKIAYKYYGNPRLWYLIAWFNLKPTDFHCKTGDIIKVPLPLEEVMESFFNMVEV